MAPAIPLIAAAAGYGAVEAGIGGAIFGTTLFDTGLFSTIGGSIAFENSLVGFVVSTAINAVGSRMSTPDKPTVAPTVDTSHATMVQSTVETHKIIYGEAKVSGPVVYIGTTDSGPVPYGGPETGTNLMLHIVVALAGHEVDCIGTVYFNDEPLTINDDGYVNSIPYPYYPDAGTANSQTINTAVRTDEVVTVTTAADHGFSIGDQVAVATTTDLSMNGTFIILDTPASDTFTYSNGGPNNTATGGTAVDNTIAAAINTYARVKKHTGSDDQEADPDMIAEIPGWDSDHRLQGIAYVYVRMEYTQNIFSRGIPNISAIVRGKKVFDPRDSSTAWSDNVALCTRDYLTSDYGFNCSTDEINDTYFSAAANACDESVALTTGGTQARYQCNGVIDTAQSPLQNLNALVAAMAGTVTYVQGQFRGYAGTYDATVGDLDTSMLAGGVSIKTRVPRNQLFNAVQGTYIDPSLAYAATDFPPVTNDIYTAADGGTQIFQDIQLPFTNHPEAAQRIAKVVLEQARQGIQLQLTLNHNAIPLAVWDTVTYTDPTLGWDHKVFRIKKFTTTGVGAITLALQEESSAAYDWDSGEATVLDAAPDTNLPDPFRVAPPSGVSYDSREASTTGSDNVYNLVLTWLPHADAFVVNGGSFEIQFRLSSDSDWRPSFFVAGDQTFADLLTSSVGVMYDARIRAISSLGVNVHSTWVERDDMIVGSSGAPGTMLDWGSVADSVGTSNDWGSVADPVGTTNDWGSAA